MTSIRIGLGYDIHRFQEGRRLVLGGVEIPYVRGLLGHSDGDCLLHAIADAILGSLGHDDIGKHFPNTDPALKGIDSAIILGKVRGMAEESGMRVVNLDAVVIAEEPKIHPFRDAMRERIASVLGIDKAAVNVKATTHERVGALGAGEAIAAYAVVLIETSDVVRMAAKSVKCKAQCSGDTACP